MKNMVAAIELQIPAIPKYYAGCQDVTFAKDW